MTAVANSKQTASIGSGTCGTARINQTFAHLRESHRKALVVYLMAGDPHLGFTERIVPQLAEAGADLIELGFPFSDPVADGPVIQAAGQRAIKNFQSLEDYLGLVRRIRAITDVPLVLMTYYNVIFRYGEQAFIDRALEVGLDGTIIPDLPLAEGLDWRDRCAAKGMAAVYLEAPNTTVPQAQAIAKGSQGFIYLVSLKGVTGAQRGLGENLEARVDRLRSQVETPLLVGFGIGNAEQARTYGTIADGVIVGSALVRRIEEASSEAAAEAAAIAFVNELRVALDAG